jgi:hypothetical protein
MRIDTEVLVADECWIALALLQRERPERTSFAPKEIMDKLRAERICGELRTGLQPHIYLHNVANLEPNSAKYRMFYRLEDGTLRLFKTGDLAHPARKGKTYPKRLGLPERYHHLLDWYEKEYCAQPSPRSATPSRDFVLEMRGVGKEIWSDGGGDAVVESLRSQWDPE